MCASDHAPTSDPRLLYAVRHPSAAGRPPVASAWVACCREPGPDERAPAYVSLHGELCAYSGPRLSGPLIDFACAAGDVVVDMASLRFIDTSGIEVLEELSNRVLRSGGFVQFHDPSPLAERLFVLLGAELAAPCHPRPWSQC